MDNLEKYIKSNRESFDQLEPRDKLWDRIESDLDQNPQQWGWIWKAAVAILIPVCGFLIWERSQTTTLVPGDLASQEIQMDPEFIETELYYTQLISEKRVLIDNYVTDDPELKASFQNDLNGLDSLYLELKNEFIATNNSSVVDAMINNLQLRMELLNQQIMILEKIDQQKNEKEPITI